MALSKTAFIPEKQFFAGTITDMNLEPRSWTDKETGQDVTKDYYKVEVQGLRNANFIKVLWFPVSEKPNGKWHKWLRAFREVGIKVKDANSLIGKSFNFEIRDVAFGDFSSEMHMPVTVYGDADIAELKAKAVELSVEEKRAQLFAKATLVEGGMTWNDFLTKVFSDELIRDDTSVRDILSNPERFAALPGLKIDGDLVSVAA